MLRRFAVPMGSTVNKCTDIVAISTVLSSETVPTGVIDAVQHGESSERFEYIPQIDMPTVAFPSTNFIESIVQLRASIDNIQFEQEGFPLEEFDYCSFCNNPAPRPQLWELLALYYRRQTRERL
ncbi:hypothetical protein F511_05524 [Dorcoceras hygrometricum]|uniref:Uncharacterized protein n=1 Tax=Dorcoceras hygrometricum TaxID=472368 RepID=A0A2Z7AUC3_9LAMI|nr:hypothetical protein F511_05524 [Dorcoceras hygrometricum]